ncbi:mismatch repair ATPase MSH6 [Ascoidea rubescens DSM 1968]|uniref:DNA mismatch repair protein n=1 Tax=Ascoidea rubescens DSM 1968 TaxID=1344418 RepID=A0A1D2VLC2_9ASCO|nr:DNA mismatch repair protein Msh6 [Ascoidea rubescens DSM 1968]ODV62416.1 DNA mismatch repair protein Msh6 [Ascoidea rubescens DSM 1968]
MTVITPKRLKATDRLKASGKKGSLSSTKKQQNIFSFFSKLPTQSASLLIKPPKDSTNQNSSLKVSTNTSNSHNSLKPKNCRKTALNQLSSPIKHEKVLSEAKPKSTHQSASDSSNKESKNSGSIDDTSSSMFVDSIVDGDFDHNSTSNNNTSLAIHPLLPSGSPPIEDGKPGLLPSSLSSKRRLKRKINYSELDDEDEDVPLQRLPNKKLRNKKIIDSDDEGEEEFIPEPIDEDDDEIEQEKDKFLSKNIDNDFASDDLGDDDLDDVFVSITTPKTKIKNKNKSKNKLKNIHDDDDKDSIDFSEKFKASSTYKPTSNKVSLTIKQKNSKQRSPTKSFQKDNEERYKWLVNIRDAEKREPTHPDYDPRTLYVPSSAWTKFTAFEKQYWEIKSKMYDCIVFFKKGKFFELYEKDALLGHNLFDLKLAGNGRANMQLAGVPEMSFDYWASEFISKGYKVAKVDQMETLLAKEIRESTKKKKEDKVIRRELSCILTGGTLTEDSMIKDDMATYCLAIRQEEKMDGSNLFGISFVDTATSKMRILEFNDDSECTNLETFINQIKPKEIIAPKGNLSSLAIRIIKFNCAENSIWNYVKDEDEFWDADRTMEEISHANYFNDENINNQKNWPKDLIKYSEKKQLGFSSFGALVWYLKSLKLDSDLISIGNIKEYNIFDNSNSSLILDGQTLQNLEIFKNSFDGSDKGTLFKFISRSITPFGKRMLRSWICHPLLNISDINERLDAVEAMMNDGNLQSIITTHLKSLPDLERLLSRVYSGRLPVKDFVKTIEGLETIQLMVNELISEYNSVEALPGSLSGIFSQIPKELEFCIKSWDNTFDREEAKTNGVLIPEKGVEIDFDESVEKMKKLENDLNKCLRSYKKNFKCQEFCFKDSGKEIFLIEVPSRYIKKIPRDWLQMGSTSKVKRYWSPEVRDLVRELLETRELHKDIVNNLKKKTYSRFSKDYALWLKAVKAIAKVDCILALCLTSESLGETACRPIFIADNEHGSLNFTELRHPCFMAGNTGAKEFIPNDIQLGGKSEAKIGLLTGANAAGKSTILRMTCIAVILAQLGCWVSSSSAKLTPIDRIMTRLGANDNIMQGKSTFLVELSETKKMIEFATPRSLLVLDELGRGGSSSDGFAIAESILYHIATHIQSLGFFATHYGSLGLSFKNHPSIKPLRMKILVDKNSRNITFLYKLEKGAAEGSFGMHVASMCGINEKIIECAEAAAKNLEHTSRIKKSNELAKLSETGIPLGLQSDFSWLLKGEFNNEKNHIGEGVVLYNEPVKSHVIKSMISMIEGL